MTRNEAIKVIVHLETTAEYYCAEGSKRQRDYLTDAYVLRMQQQPPETRKLYELQSVLRMRSQRELRDHATTTTRKDQTL